MKRAWKQAVGIHLYLQLGVGTLGGFTIIFSPLTTVKLKLKPKWAVHIQWTVLVNRAVLKLHHAGL